MIENVMHKCDLLVISCIDFRFQEHLRSFLEKDYKGNYDLVCVAGSAKNFVSGSEADKETVLKQVKISKELHHIKKVFLINHQNCGAYGEAFVSGSLQEKETHVKNLITAKEEINKVFPDLEIYLYFIEFKTEPITNVKFAPAL